MPQKRAYEGPQTGRAGQLPMIQLPPDARPLIDAATNGPGTEFLEGLIGLRGPMDPPGTAPPTWPMIAGGAASAAIPFLKSLNGKPIDELLDLVLRVVGKSGPTGLPKKLRFTNVGRNGQMQFHPEGMSEIGPAPFEASTKEIDRLISGGALEVDQPPQGAVDAIQRKLQRQFDAATGDPRNPTIGTPRENKSPMRRTLDEIPEAKQPRKRAVEVPAPPRPFRARE